MANYTCCPNVNNPIILNVVRYVESLLQAKVVFIEEKVGVIFWISPRCCIPTTEYDCNVCRVVHRLLRHNEEVLGISPGLWM